MLVSASRESSASTRFEIKATVDGLLRLRDNFAGREPEFSQPVTPDGRDYVLPMKAGQTLVGTLDKLDAPVPEPQESLEVRQRLRRIEKLHAKKFPSRNPRVAPLE